MTEKQTFVGKYMTDIDLPPWPIKEGENKTKITGMEWDNEILTLVGEDFYWSAHRSVLGITGNGLRCLGIGMGVDISDD